MSHFTKILDGIDTAPLLAELDAQPWLWNTRENRRDGDSPHRETDDLWIRYRDPAELRGPADFAGPHVSVNYPAFDALPALVPILSAVVNAVRPVRMGGILMSRVPPGCHVYPHHDRGTWHAEYYDTKVWLPLRANERCINHVEDEAIVWRVGEAWSHDNLKVHAVENEGDTDRICLIMCFRCH